MMVTILSLFASSCNDDEVIETSVQVTTQGFARVGQTTAFVSAYITKGTVSDNMVVGFCWSETTSPDVEDRIGRRYCRKRIYVTNGRTITFNGILC